MINTPSLAPPSNNGLASHSWATDLIVQTTSDAQAPRNREMMREAEGEIASRHRQHEIPQFSHVLTDLRLQSELPNILPVLASCQTADVLNITAAFIRSNGGSQWMVGGKALTYLELKEAAVSTCGSAHARALFDVIDSSDYLQLSLLAKDSQNQKEALTAVFGKKSELKGATNISAALGPDEVIWLLKHIGDTPKVAACALPSCPHVSVKERYQFNQSEAGRELRHLLKSISLSGNERHAFLAAFAQTTKAELDVAPQAAQLVAKLLGAACSTTALFTFLQKQFRDPRERVTLLKQALALPLQEAVKFLNSSTKEDEGRCYPKDDKTIEEVLTDFAARNSNVTPKKIAYFKFELENVVARCEELKGLSETDFTQSIALITSNCTRELSSEQKINYLAHARELMIRSTGIYPNVTQLFAFLLLSDLDSAESHGICAEIDTGQGKSVINAMLAGARALSGKQVAILTVNSYLAERDNKNFKSFFEKLQVSCDHLDFSRDFHSKFMRDTPRLAYMTPADLVFARGRAGVEGLSPYEPQECIIDEADGVLLDSACDMFRLSAPGSALLSNEILENVFYVVQRMRSEEIDPARFLYEAQKDPRLREIEPTVLALLIKNVEFARSLEEDVHFVKQDGQIVVVDYQQTDRKLPISFWTHGVYEFVCLFNGCRLPETSYVTVAQLSIVDVVSQIPKIFCVSGTTGDLDDHYNLTKYSIPPHQRSQMRHTLPRLFLKREELVVGLLKEISSSDQPHLVQIGGIKESYFYADVLRCSHHEIQILNDVGNRDARSRAAREQTIVDQAGKTKVTTITTGAGGRGTDIILHEDAKELGGLRTIVVSWPKTAREFKQRIGRAGRKGESGESITMLALDEDLFLKTLPVEVKDGLAALVTIFESDDGSVEIEWALNLIHLACNHYHNNRRAFALEQSQDLHELQQEYFQLLRTARAEFISRPKDEAPKDEINTYLDKLIRNTWAEAFAKADLELAAYINTLVPYVPESSEVAMVARQLVDKVPPPSYDALKVFGPALQALAKYIFSAIPMEDGDLNVIHFDELSEHLSEAREDIEKSAFRLDAQSGKISNPDLPL